MDFEFYGRIEEAIELLEEAQQMLFYPPRFDDGEWGALNELATNVDNALKALVIPPEISEAVEAQSRHDAEFD